MSLQVQGVQKSFGPIKAVRDVSFAVPKGKVLGLIGPNGAGKTTTMRMILRILNTDAGLIEWDEKPVSSWPLGTFGYLPEERGLYPLMRARDELRFFGNLHGMTTSEADAAIDSWTARLELKSILNKKVDDLSKGNAQKLQFLAAVLHQPQLLILDEPFSGLDPMNTRLFKDAVRYVRSHGTTILFSSHQMDHVEELCDFVCMISDGRTAINGTVKDVRKATGRRIVTLVYEEGSPNEVGTSAFPQLPGLTPLGSDGPKMRFALQGGTEPNRILQGAAQIGPVQHFSIDYPTLEEIYIEKVTSQKQSGEAQSTTGGAA